MWKVSRLNDDGTLLYLHAFRLKRDAQGFAARWRNANPGSWTRIGKVAQ